MYKLKVSIPVVPELPNKIRMKKWFIIRSIEKKLQERMMIVLNGLQPDKPLRQFTLTLTRRTSRQPDFDNLVASFKPVIDCFTKNKFIEDDKPANMKSLTCLWRLEKNKNAHIEIELEEL